MKEKQSKNRICGILDLEGTCCRGDRFSLSLASKRVCVCVSEGEREFSVLLVLMINQDNIIE